MQAFVHGIDAAVDVLELDVRRTLDGVLVVNHDAKVVKGTPSIKRLLFADLPKLADGQALATLEGVAELARARGAKLAVEIKERGYEREIVNALQSHLGNDQFEVISFYNTSLKRVEAMDGGIRTGLLAPRVPGMIRESGAYRGVVALMDKLDWQPSLNRGARVGADYVSVDIGMATPRFIAGAERRGIPLDVWTVDQVTDMERLVTSGVQGIVTDHPDVAMNVRASLLAASEHSAAVVKTA